MLIFVFFVVVFYYLGGSGSSTRAVSDGYCSSGSATIAVS